MPKLTQLRGDLTGVALTQREQLIFNRFGGGEGVSKIAKDLHTKPKTIDATLKKALQKKSMCREELKANWLAQEKAEQ